MRGFEPMDKITKKALRAIAVPAFDWDRWFRRNCRNGNEVQAIQDRLLSIAQWSAHLAEYLSYRGAAGCGDHGHEPAKKAADKKLRRVRKALGYSYP